MTLPKETPKVCSTFFAQESREEWRVALSVIVPHVSVVGRVLILRAGKDGSSSIG
jgi:hypothetical protein